MLQKLLALCLLLPLGPIAIGADDDVPIPVEQVPVKKAPVEPTPVEQERVRGELPGLIEQLDSERYEVRRRAAETLEQWVGRDELGTLLSGEFQRLLLRTDVSFEVRWHLERWARRLPPPPPVPPEAISAAELERLIAWLDDDSHSVRLAAVGRLRWLLGRDEQVPLLKRAIEARLQRPIDPSSSGQLRKLLELTRPAMVAEYWQGGRHLAEQHLIVGVPSLSAGAVRPSHFDRIDDEVAHCVSGHNLSPGDYPVGVAFPHPNQPGAFFCLINLSTPRRRMDYERRLRTDESQRLAALSRRTLDRLLAARRPLARDELVMLAQLDHKEVSRFAGKHFHLVEDKPLSRTLPGHGAGLSSRFGMICARLATDGTQEAVPGLLEAIEKNRFLPPTSTAPYQYHWLAALAIAGRDPWPEVDSWLAEQIPRDDIPVEGSPHGPEIGATAAALLLTRHGRTPAQFGLQPAVEPMLLRLGVKGHRFSTADARKNVQRWWDEQRLPR